ncbi:MAG TPA: DUF2865 domain-containing protein [Xanthobacteraceae bacterium]|nr:DUF2865 domain-containing protein [Xanthobacteraceae bacterium]
MTGTFPRRVACVALLTLFLPAAAAAQVTYPQAAPPAGGAPNPVCGRLEAQLAAIDRGAGADPARAEQTRRIEETLNKQQADLDRTQSQWQRLGCQPPSLFSIFSNQSPQCGPLNNQISQMRATIDRTMAELQRSRHGADDDMQRQGVLGALAQNNCGPQYRVAVAPQKGFFETLFGGGGAPSGAIPPGGADYPQIGGNGYRTLCVRTCDGFYFPISYSTSPTRFAEDEQTCQKLCPATEAVLYSHRNPGEDVAQAVAGNGRAYKDLANAFRYRREFIASCSCKQAGQTWAEALGQTKDSTIERGDIVVTEDRAKALSQPRSENPSRNAVSRTDTRKPTGNLPVAAPSDAPESTPPATEPGKRTVRTVGPTFIPAQ